ncbi:unnamed protein product [Adineta steineri]|uniref:NHL repeat containing protein n=1 Tax=Adineta steineri TaxID=433720 RepID=A0A814LL06_9BILA|nr:unnamed protein product [Adineta steineri]
MKSFFSSLLVQSKPKYNKWKQHGITVAGGNKFGSQLNQLNSPHGIYIDHNKAILVADTNNHRIVEWKYNAKEGQIISGGNGQGNSLDQLNTPIDVTVDKEKNAIIICDHGNERVMRLFRQSQAYPQILISNIACGGVAIDKDGCLYVSDYEKSEVRRWKEGDTDGTLVAGGNGKGDRRNRFQGPRKIFVDEEYSIYVVDSENHRIMKWKKDAKIGISVAGGNEAGNKLNELNSPYGLIIDNWDQIFIVDTKNNRVMRWHEEDAKGSIVVGGNRFPGEESDELYVPIGVTFDVEGNLYVADSFNDRIQKYEPCTGRAYDRDYNENSPGAYNTTPITAQGSMRFYEVQSVMKQLAIPYTEYHYKTTIINARGKSYTSINEMCSLSYINLICTNNSNGLDPRDQLWEKLLEEYHKAPLNLYNFGNFYAFCRFVIGDEACDFLKDTYRFRSWFKNINAYAFMEYYDHDSKLYGPIYYPNQGMSQFPKRMMYNATTFYDARLYLNEEILSIDDIPNQNCYPFAIETTRYSIRAQQIIAAIDPLGWQSITGSIANDIKSNEHFQSILPIKTVTIQCYWPHRWWEESKIYGSDVDRIWTRQNCITIAEIFSQRPEQRFQNAIRIVYDDGQCVEMWSALIARSSQEDLINEILRGLQSIFTDVSIQRPTKIFTKIWQGDWHFQTANSHITNRQILSWALNPLPRFNRNQLSLVGEAFYLNRAIWTEAAVKSSLISLTSQFNFKFNCFENDSTTSGGRFCPSDFI